ncbi:MAG TPA: type VII secretion-associated serine protease mycosin [Micromonosporaceae bacterium]
MAAGLLALACAVASVAPSFAEPAGVGGGHPQGGFLRTDPIREGQWQLREYGITAAWRHSTGAGVTVAVIDSGVDGSHPDLVGQVLPGTDLVESGGDGHLDPVGHGTAVAALIAGRGDDREGVVGIAPDAKILPVRVLDADNRYDDAQVVARAVRWAVDNGAQVINLSLGGTATSAALAAAIDYAFDRDVVVVACTGNVTSPTATEVWYPAREPGVVAVTGLTRRADELWPSALTGPQTVLAAPATDLISARPDGYWRVQGTSFAAPIVAATAALIRARWPTMTAGEVVNRLIDTARDLGPAGRDDTFGFGRVDPLAALTADVPKVDRNPLDDGVSPGTVGLGPAPGRHTAPTPGTPPNVRARGLDSGWADRSSTARPADRPGTLNPWLLLILIPVAGGALLVVLRLRRNGRWRRPE